MGVRGCFRRGCDNIMCDTYISEIGYICNDCKREFKKYLVNNSIAVRQKWELISELESFMETRKDEYWDRVEPINIDEFFNEHTQ